MSNIPSAEAQSSPVITYEEALQRQQAFAVWHSRLIEDAPDVGENINFGITYAQLEGEEPLDGITTLRTVNSFGSLSEELQLLLEHETIVAMALKRHRNSTLELTWAKHQVEGFEMMQITIRSRTGKAIYRKSASIVDGETDYMLGIFSAELDAVGQKMGFWKFQN